MRYRFLPLIIAATFALGACSSAEPETLETTPTNSVAAEPTTTGVSQDPKDKVLTAGDSFDVPCSYVDPTTCMTIEITDIDPDAECKTYDNSAEGRFVALKLEATMPDDADPEFTSPFRRSPWRASTTEGEISAVDPEVVCEGGETILNLMDEFPGYSAIGTAFIAVQNNVDLIHFEVSDKADVRIDVASKGETSQQVAPSSEEPAASVPAEPAPAEVFVEEAPEPAPHVQQEQPAPEPVVGFTEAPGQTDPYVMDKQVASCGDPMMHQTGTTFFTDGTSGWTQQCANQMGW